MRDYQTYIKAELMVLIPVLYILGDTIKLTDKIDKRFIPLVLGFAGTLLSMIYVVGQEGLSLTSLFTAITQGILVAGAAVYAYELKDHLFNKDDDEDKEE